MSGGRDSYKDGEKKISDSVLSYDLYGNQNDVEDGSEDWFLGGASNNPLASGDDLEAQEALSQGGSTDVLISNPKVDSSKTYSLEESMGAVDMSGISTDKDFKLDYTGSDLYYAVTGEDKQGTATGGSYHSEKTGKNESGVTSQEDAYRRSVKDRWLQEAKSGRNDDYYIDGSNQIKARKKQVNLVGYDGGTIGASNSGVR